MEPGELEVHRPSPQMLSTSIKTNARSGSRVGGGGRETATAEDLVRCIPLADRLKKVAADADTFRAECSQLARRADLLALSLRAAVRSLSAHHDQPPYSPLVRRVAAAASRALDRGISLARRSRRRRLLPSPAVLLRFVPFADIGAADFRRALGLLDASVSDIGWLVSLYSDNGVSGGASDAGVGLGPPPVADSDTVLYYIWTCIATVQMAVRPSDRADAAQSLAELALDGHRNRRVIVDEGGIPPLLALLKNDYNEACQYGAASALANLTADDELVFALIGAHAIPVIVEFFTKSTSKRLQTRLVYLIARIAAVDAAASEEFAWDNVIRPIITLLSFDLSLAEVNEPSTVSTLQPPSRSSSPLFLTNGESEHEIAAEGLELEVASSEALWMLCKASISNSRKVVETIGLLCLARLMETGNGHLQYNCLMAVAEIAAAAESDANLRGEFKKNPTVAKSVVDQLLRLVQGGIPVLQLPAIRSIGSLARIFPARGAQVLGPLVAQLGHRDEEVRAEAAAALGKFASPDNFLCVEHSTAIVESDAVPALMRLLRPEEKSRVPGLLLLCYLASHVPSHQAWERAKVLLVLESVDRSWLTKQPLLNELIPKACRQLRIYRPGTRGL